MPDDNNSQNNKDAPLGLDPVKQGVSSPLPNQPAGLPQTDTSPSQTGSTTQADTPSLQPSPVIDNVGGPDTTATADTPAPAAPPPTLGLDVAPPPVAPVPPPSTIPQTPSGGDEKSKKSKSKGKSKKVVAAVLGVLVLVGGIAAGVMLVRQQQDIREKAAGDEVNGIGEQCLKGGTGPGYRDATFEGRCKVAKCPYGDTDGDNACDLDDRGFYYDGSVNCSQGLSALDGECGQVDPIGTDGRYCKTDSNKGHYGKVLSDCSGEPPPPPPPPPTDTPPSGQCIELLAFDTEGNQLTAQDLSQLSAGDSFILGVRGSASQGQITKARFSVNEQQRPEVAVKQNIGGIEYFVDTYTIPDGVTEFSIGGEVFHPDLGWL